MMGNILWNARYSAQQASEELGLPLEEMEALYRDCVTGKRGNFHSSYFGDLTRPTINGYDLLQLVGQPTGVHQSSHRQIGTRARRQIVKGPVYQAMLRKKP